MPWIIFDSIDFEQNRKSKAGKPYDCYVLRGIKKGFDGAADEPYEKIFFENSATSIIEKGVVRPNVSIVQFLQKGCNPGDTISIKNVRRSGRWELESIENKTAAKSGTAADYEPLTNEQLEQLRSMQMPAMSDPTRPAAPATPMMAPINYTPAS